MRYDHDLISATYPPTTPLSTHSLPPSTHLLVASLPLSDGAGGVLEVHACDNALVVWPLVARGAVVALVQGHGYLLLGEGTLVGAEARPLVVGVVGTIVVHICWSVKKYNY